MSTARLSASIAAAVAVLLVAAPVHAEQRLFAVVVGSNASDGSLPPLRYADDDAVAWAELLESLGAKVRLLAVLDPETQRLHRSAAARAQPPARQALLDALAATFEEITAARAAGDEAELLFVYAGHGAVEGSEGHLFLGADRWTRSDLFRHLLEPSPARFNHVVIDACYAYFLVASRGLPRVDADGGAVRAYLAAEDLQAHPGTGVLVSTAGAAEVHEFSLFRAGVFSHELRSALRGGADVNLDGRIEYSEVAAFLAAANGAVDDPRARIEVFSRPPAADLQRPLLDLSRAGGPRVTLGAGRALRFYVEDERGVRLGDFHKAADAGMTLALPGPGRYWARTDDSEAVIDVGPTGSVSAGALESWGELTVASRGAVADAFRRKLFAMPFGPSFYSGHVVSSGGIPARLVPLDVPRPPPPGAPVVAAATKVPGALAAISPQRDGGGPLGSPSERGFHPALRWGALAVAASLAGGAAWAGLEATSTLDEQRTLLHETGVEDPALRERIDSGAALSTGLWIGAGIAAAAGGVLFVLDDP